MTGSFRPMGECPRDGWTLLRLRDPDAPNHVPADMHARPILDRTGAHLWQFEDGTCLRLRDEDPAAWSWRVPEPRDVDRLADGVLTARLAEAEAVEAGPRPTSVQTVVAAHPHPLGHAGLPGRYVTRDACGRKAFMATLAAAGWMRRTDAGGAHHALETATGTLRISDVRSVEGVRDRTWRVAFMVDGTGEAPCPVPLLHEADPGWAERTDPA